MPDIYFQCPECEGELAVEARGIGSRLPCPFCASLITVPDIPPADFPSEDGTPQEISDNNGHPARLPGARSIGSLPRKRNDPIAGIQSRRGKRETEFEDDEAVLRAADLSLLDAPVRDLVRKELERLRVGAARADEKSNSPTDSKPPGRKRPPPPLAQHGAVVSTENLSAPSRSRVYDPNRRRRIAPQTHSDKPLPELVTLESMDLESDVARSWGEDAVIDTKRLHRLATLIVILIVGGGGWLIYNTLSNWSQSKPEADTQSIAEEPPEENPLLAQVHTTLSGFLKSSTPEEKARFIRNRESKGAAMAQYYLVNGREPPSYDSDLNVRPLMVGSTPFLSIDGEYTPSLRSFHLEMERLPDGSLLIDWPSLTGYNENDWDEFLETRPQEPQTFRLWMEVQSYYAYEYADPEKHLNCGLREDATSEGKLIFGYAPRGSEAEAQVATTLSNLRAERKLRRRVTVKLRFEPVATRQEPVQLIIDEVVAEHWVEFNEG